MKVIKKIDEMRRAVSGIKSRGMSIGFVPTMGYLHEGHLSLVRESIRKAGVTVVSIFVNPAQFGPREDFKEYPRDLNRDSEVLEREGVDYLFVPEAGEMYPQGYKTYVEVHDLQDKLCGRSRPGHFRGVCTVVLKLFNIVNPDISFFGQKDAQQAAVIKKMVADLNMNLQIVTVPTVREPDGLAMSSRNTYLNSEERKQATVLYQALNLSQKLWAQGEKDAKIIRQQMTDLIQKQPLANIDYISIADAVTLEELDVVKPPALVSMAVRIGETRLIDNVVVGQRAN